MRPRAAHVTDDMLASINQSPSSINVYAQENQAHERSENEADDHHR
jgi:hypothetical protein